MPGTTTGYWSNPAWHISGMARGCPSDTWLEANRRTRLQTNTKGSLCLMASPLDCKIQNHALRHKSLISMHMVLINLCMQMECLVSQNHTAGIDVEKAAQVVWHELMNEIWIEIVLKCFFLRQAFFFLWENKEAASCSALSTVLTKWMKNDTSSQKNSFPRTNHNQIQASVVVYCNGSQISSGDSIHEIHNIKVLSVTTSVINSIHCLQTFSVDLFLKVSLLRHNLYFENLLPVGKVAGRGIHLNKFLKTSTPACGGNMLISAVVTSYHILIWAWIKHSGMHTFMLSDRDELYPSVCC